MAHRYANARGRVNRQVLGTATAQEVPINSTVADVELDISFPADASEVDMAGFRLAQVSPFTDRKTWSSLAVVLLLHTAAACILWLSPKPQDSGRKWIDVRLVSLQGKEAGAQTAEPGPTAPPAAPGATAIHESANLQATPEKPAPKNEKILPPATPKSHVQSNERRKKIEMAAVRPIEQKQIQPEQSLNPTQTESVPRQSEGSGEGSGAGPAAAGVHSDRVAGGKNGPGGAGPAERALGSPDGPSFLRKVLPSYPPLAKRLEKEGTVLLRVTIDERGRPVEVEVIRKAGFGFDEEAVRAVKDSTFVPAQREGKPLACRALLPIRFVLTSS